MNKVILITDTHHGANQSNYQYFLYQKSILNQIIEYAVQNNISQIYNLGDFSDNKKYFDILIYNDLHEIMDKSSASSIHWHMLSGNHDNYYQNNTDVSSMKLFNKFSNIITYTDPIYIEQNDLLICPWLSAEHNRELFLNLLSTKKPKIVFGHFDVIGFLNATNIEIKDGFSMSQFTQIPLVISGHIHLKQSTSNIHYIGPPWDINWGDAYTTKGFHVLDFDTLQLEFHPHDQKYFQYYSVNIDNYIEIIDNIKLNPNRQFKFKLDSEIPEFIDFLENKFEYPENIKTQLIQSNNNGDEPLLEINTQGTIKDTLGEYTKQNSSTLSNKPEDIMDFFGRIEQMEIQ